MHRPNLSGLCASTFEFHFQKALSEELYLLGYNAVYSVESQPAYSSTLKMEATRSSETSADFRRTTRRYIREVKLFTTTAVRT
jgi:hypothetical protein